MKERLLVMNGQRIVQAEREGGWKTLKVDKAGALRPGIYNLYTAQAADKKLAHEGVIVYADASHVYQQVGKKFVMHACADFDKVPSNGILARIDYSAEGKAIVAAEIPKLAQGISR